MPNRTCCLVTGASGFVGRRLCRRLLDDGHSVIGVVRNATKFPEFKGSSFVTVNVGNIDADTDWDYALNNVDAVFHLAAESVVSGYSANAQLEQLRKTNVAGTCAISRAAVSHKVKRFIYVSTIKVNGEKSPVGSCFTEASIPAPISPYGISKWEAEQALWGAIDGSKTEGIVLRPPLVYGAETKGNFLQLLRLVAQRMPLPFARVNNRRSLIYIENLVNAIVICATHPLAAGNTYLLSDAESASTADLIRMLAAELGVPVRLFYCPQFLMQLAARLLGKTEQIDRLLGSLLVDGSKIGRDLNWVLPYSLQQGLRTTVAWYERSLRANKL